MKPKIITHKAVYRPKNADGGLNVGYIENGDWLRYNSLDFGSGASSFEASSCSAASGGNWKFVWITLLAPWRVHALYPLQAAGKLGLQNLVLSPAYLAYTIFFI